MILRIIIILLVTAIVGAVLWGWMRTRKVESDAQQMTFAAGAATLPTAGRYKGSSGEYKGSWQGKVIYADNRGENSFKRESGEELKYPFGYYVSRGVRDKNLEVVVLDYNQPGNPWWLRLVRDEIVATGEGRYLGKVHVYVLPNLYFTLGYFSLEFAE